MSNAGTPIRSPNSSLTVNGNFTPTGVIQFDAGSGLATGLMMMNGHGKYSISGNSSELKPTQHSPHGLFI